MHERDRRLRGPSEEPLNHKALEANRKESLEHNVPDD